MVMATWIINRFLCTFSQFSVYPLGGGPGKARVGLRARSTVGAYCSVSCGLPTPLSRWCDQSQGCSPQATGAGTKGRMPSFPGSPGVPCPRFAGVGGARRLSGQPQHQGQRRLRGVTTAPHAPGGTLTGRQCSTPTTTFQGCLDRRLPPGRSPRAPLGEGPWRGTSHRCSATWLS